MNDFTKEELEDIYDCLYYENKGSEEKYYSKLLDKIESMIMNYCDHERRCEKVCLECQVSEYKCNKCADIIYEGD